MMHGKCGLKSELAREQKIFFFYPWQSQWETRGAVCVCVCGGGGRGGGQDLKGDIIVSELTNKRSL